ncbi:TPA: tetratricopeptide repeat protein [Citrobacter freundii]|uniref:tetratricopeptide repeat protein n=1 Tax=Citrobacter freundii TaxID=546 RepID=UPI00397CDD32
MNIRPLLTFTFIGILWGAGSSQGQAKEWNKEPVAVLQQGAEAGDAQAQFVLATVYLKGKEVEQNFSKGSEWLTKSAEQGNLDARYLLALVYFDGEGARWYDGKVIEWFDNEVGKGNKQAVEWLSIAAERGNYHAIEWLHRAVEKGNPDAKRFLESKALLLDGYNTVKSLSKAAERGDAKAQGMLGTMYLEGKGVTQDYAQAYIWSAVAFANGNSDAQNGLDIAQKNLTPTALKEADDKARRYFEQHRNQSAL